VTERRRLDLHDDGVPVAASAALARVGKRVVGHRHERLGVARPSVLRFRGTVADLLPPVAVGLPELLACSLEAP
jgi:hypothetical protein